MSFLSRVLDEPSYGWERNGKLYVPTHRELWREFFTRMNIFKTRKAWMPLMGWSSILLFAPFFFVFLYGLLENGVLWFHDAFRSIGSVDAAYNWLLAHGLLYHQGQTNPYFTWWLFLAAFVYSMVILGTHGTVYLHRYGTHHAFTFKNKFWLFLTRELVMKIVPEEMYMISHHVHHQSSEKPGDPYNVYGGWLYCFLADVNHQSVARDLSREDYARMAGMIKHTGIPINSYEQYQKWGSIAHPLWTVLHFGLNWAFWGAVFYFLGGWPLLVALFAGAGFWAVGIRTYNFEGHGGGKDKRKDGIDFDRSNLSINQNWPGLVTGEWHNNHHLYPNGIRNGFQPYQLDYAWWLICAVRALGGIDTWRDQTDQFLAKYYLPYLKQKAMEKAEANTVKS